MINRFLAFQQRSPILVAGIVWSVIISCLLLTVVITCVITWNVKPDPPREVEVVETQEVVMEVTPTPNIQETLSSIVERGAVEATAMIELGRAQMTLESVNTELERQQALAGMTQTAVAPVYTLEPTATLTPIDTPTSTSTATPEAFLGKGHNMACVDDNSGGSDFLGECITALKATFPEAEVVGYKGCDHELLTSKWSVVVMDYTMSNSLDGGACTRAVLLTHPNTNVVGYSMDGTWEVEKFLDAGANEFVRKPNLTLLVETIRRLLENG